MGLMSQKMDKRFLAVWAYHKATKTIITEHNWSFTFSQDAHGQIGGMMSSMCGVNEFQSAFPSGIPAGPTTPAGCAKHCATMAKVLTLDVRAALDFHSFPKDMNRRWRSQELFLKEMRAALEAANEDDPSG